MYIRARVYLYTTACAINCQRVIMSILRYTHIYMNLCTIKRYNVYVYKYVLVYKKLNSSIPYEVEYIELYAAVQYLFTVFTNLFCVCYYYVSKFT